MTEELAKPNYFTANYDRIGKLCAQLEGVIVHPDTEPGARIKCRYIADVLAMIHNEPEIFDANTRLTMAHIKNAMDNCLRRMEQDPCDDDHMSEAMIILSRLCREGYARGRIKAKPAIDLLNYFGIDNNQLTDRERQEAIVGPQEVNNLLYFERIAEIDLRAKEAAAAYVDVGKKFTEYGASLAITQELVKKAMQEAHFVGLYNAFNELCLRKKRGLSKLRKGMRFLIFLTTFITGLPIIFVAATWPVEVTDPAKLYPLLIDKGVLTLTTILPLLLLSVYWLRTKYMEYKSEAGILLQLEVRRSICQFIQGYGDWCKEQDPTRVQLDKFAAMIFSNITPDPAAVPGVFDGMDQFANLIKAVKEPKKG